MLHALHADQRRLDLALMLVLTFTTGMIDAVGYLGLDFIFAGNMTGNVLILGMGLGKAADVPVAGPALALLMFGVGATIGGRLLRGSPQAWGRGTTTAVAVTGAATAGAALLFVLLPGAASEPAPRSVAVALLSGAMGLQAAAARQLGVADVTTVVVTSTLTRLFADFGAGASGPWARRAGAVVLIGAGAAVGAVLLRVHISLALAAPAVLVLAVAGIGAARRRPAGNPAG